MPGIWERVAWSWPRMARYQPLCTQTALDGDGQLRPHAAHRDQALEDAFLLPIEKPVKSQGIFAHVGMDKERDLGSLGGRALKVGTLITTS